MFTISKSEHWKSIKCWIELNFRYPCFFCFFFFASCQCLLFVRPIKCCVLHFKSPGDFLSLDMCSKLSKHDDFLFLFEIKCNWNIQKVQYFICRRKSYCYNDDFLYLPYIIVLRHLRTYMNRYEDWVTHDSTEKNDLHLPFSFQMQPKLLIF